MTQREPAAEERQGERGKPTLIALIVGLVLVLAIGAGLLTYQGSKTPPGSSPESSQQPVDGPKSGATNSSSSDTVGREPPANPNTPAPAQPKP